MQRFSIPDHIAAPALPLQPRMKRFYGLRPVLVKLDYSSTASTDTAPFPGQGGIAKQTRSDRQHIVTSCVADRIASFEHQGLDRVSGHASCVARRTGDVQSKNGIVQRLSIHSRDEFRSVTNGAELRSG